MFVYILLKKDHILLIFHNRIDDWKQWKEKDFVIFVCLKFLNKKKKKKRP